MVSRKERKQSNTNRIWINFLRVYNTSKLINIAFISCMMAMAAGLAFSTYLTCTTSAIPVSGSAYSGQRLPALWPNAKTVLFLGVPGLSEVTRTQNAVKITPEVTSRTVSHRLVSLLTNIDFRDLRTLFTQEIPFMLAFKKSGTPVVSAATLPNFPQFDSQSASKEKPLVGIYHTHTAESFIPDSGVAHRPGGQCGDIVEVGEALAHQLEQAGVKAIHSRAIHDYPSFMKAYGPSEATVQKMLAENPSLQMIFDIHRDAEKRENVTTIINGIQVAKIAIVVATGHQDLPQPHWQQNHAFAKLIEAKLNEKYPGLCRGILLEEWRYNQHLHPRALLLEVGSQESSKEEAIRSMELLGDILVEILAENR
ncbi:Stage II sporulation protein P (SpoIIP) [Sporomusa ovata DSM 2662]|uniref:Stage II sporulation protein P n=1 Tax=Sporomusa ovata TaxID=2378 RepID=A0A0U1KXD5_9FIRM|nr:stage II sporulation protein P [Sporomusa ovata]EQB29573.1 stage II sporulation P [Sporomusa ovata DSM 2662]CQR72087.1 Stage II sporulation protein P [Sporomusa ovata]